MFVKYFSKDILHRVFCYATQFKKVTKEIETSIVNNT